MKNENAVTIEKFYAALGAGDLKSALALCSESMTFQIAGKSKIAGKYTPSNVGSALVSQWKELSGGTHKLEIHDILASDRHAVALVSEFVTRNGAEVQMRCAHVWRFEGGKPAAWYEYPRDLYQFDGVWG